MEDNFDDIKRSLAIPLYTVLVLWGVQLLSLLTGARLGYWGIYPRHVGGLVGIITGPLIHSDFSHLANNSLPLFVSGFILFLFYPRIAQRSYVLLFFLTGMAVWLFARPVHHIGASGVVYALVSFIFWTGVFRRNTRSIALALVVMVLYSGMLAGLLPDPEEKISWESHLLGLLVGAVVAYVYRKELEPDELEDFEERATSGNEEALSGKSYFLPRDVFEKTKEERRRGTEQRPDKGQVNDNWFTNGVW